MLTIGPSSTKDEFLILLKKSDSTNFTTNEPTFHALVGSKAKTNHAQRLGVETQTCVVCFTYFCCLSNFPVSITYHIEESIQKVRQPIDHAAIHDIGKSWGVVSLVIVFTGLIYWIVVILQASIGA